MLRRTDAICFASSASASGVIMDDASPSSATQQAWAREQAALQGDGAITAVKQEVEPAPVAHLMEQATAAQ